MRSRRGANTAEQAETDGPEWTVDGFVVFAGDLQERVDAGEPLAGGRSGPPASAGGRAPTAAVLPDGVLHKGNQHVLD